MDTWRLIYMRGTVQAQPDFLTVVNLNAVVFVNHPLRASKRRADDAAYGCAAGSICLPSV